MLIFPLLACAELHGGCGEGDRDVSDDEVLGDIGVTAADMLAQAVGTFELPGVPRQSAPPRRRGP